ncbi:hypothetical protein VTN49DRAFT_691 [Thermomyces lanuginosus]|uniref:uncharacterized protein n=1 Tax=Thermomyces lanuginosus TaxID=5541 RepID=UPI0037447BB7
MSRSEEDILRPLSGEPRKKRQRYRGGGDGEGAVSDDARLGFAKGSTAGEFINLSSPLINATPRFPPPAARSCKSDFLLLGKAGAWTESEPSLVGAGRAGPCIRSVPRPRMVQAASQSASLRGQIIRVNECSLHAIMRGGLEPPDLLPLWSWSAPAEPED